MTYDIPRSQLTTPLYRLAGQSALAVATLTDAVVNQAELAHREPKPTMAVYSIRLQKAAEWHRQQASDLGPLPPLQPPGEQRTVDEILTQSAAAVQSVKDLAKWVSEYAATKQHQLSLVFLNGMNLILESAADQAREAVVRNTPLDTHQLFRGSTASQLRVVRSGLQEIADEALDTAVRHLRPIAPKGAQADRKGILRAGLLEIGMAVDHDGCVTNDFTVNGITVTADHVQPILGIDTSLRRPTGPQS